MWPSGVVCGLLAGWGGANLHSLSQVTSSAGCAGRPEALESLKRGVLAARGTPHRTPHRTLRGPISSAYLPPGHGWGTSPALLSTALLRGRHAGPGGQATAVRTVSGIGPARAAEPGGALGTSSLPPSPSVVRPPLLRRRDRRPPGGSQGPESSGLSVLHPRRGCSWSTRPPAPGPLLGAHRLLLLPLVSLSPRLRGCVVGAGATVRGLFSSPVPPRCHQLVGCAGDNGPEP